MWIEQLNIDAFGKMRNVRMQFESGLTVIYGANESGKSTLMAFVRAMLYGMNGRSASLQLNDRKRCMPWGAVSMGGSLRLRDGSSIYEIQRTFGQTKKSDTCRVTDVLTGEILPVPAGEEPGQVLLGIDEAMFADTLFISWQGSKIAGDGAALGEKIRNRIGTGEEEVDLQKLLNRLHTARSEILPRTKEKGKLYETRAELDAARRELLRSTGCAQRIADLREEIVKLNGLEEQTRSRNRRVDAHEQAVRVLYDGHVREKELAEHISSMEAEQKSGKTHRALGVICIVLGLLLVITGGAAWALQHSAWLLLLVPAAALAVCGAWMLRRENKNGDAQLDALRREYADTQAENVHLGESVRAMAAALEKEQALDSSQMTQERLMNARMELEGLLREQKKQPELKKRIAELEKREEKLQTAAEAMEMAQSELQNAARDRQNGYVPDVVRTMREMLHCVTDGKYDQAAVSRSLEISLQSENGSMQPWDYFSTGTVELMYLALRMSLARLLCRRNGALPMLLDDPFLCMDEARTQRSLELVLQEMQGERQALLFTCRKEIARTGGIRIINL